MIGGWAKVAGQEAIEIPSLPTFTQVTDDLWMGGYDRLATIPGGIKYVLSLYKHGSYEDGSDVMFDHVEMHDSAEVDDFHIKLLADNVNGMRKYVGPVLVHCQMGLNRSGLIVAAALVRDGMEPQAAIDLLREKRDALVLFNPHFENYILNMKGSS